MSLRDLQLRLEHGRGEADDWTKIGDKTLRKTIQNRLAQRKRRTKLLKGNPRKPAELPTRPTPTDEQATSHDNPSNSTTTTSTSSTSSISPITQQTRRTSESPLSSSFTSSVETPSIIISKRQDALHDVLAPQMREFLACPGLAEHRFIILSQYSFLRAFVHNARALDLDPSLFVDDNSLSPWTVFNPYPADSKPFLNTLAPTPIQLSTFHHPYIDVLASPQLCSNIVVARLDDDQEDAFCHALHADGFTVWGSQPWDPMGWELSQNFVYQWGWLVDEDSIRYSNFWRFERGEMPLNTPPVAGEILGEIA